MVSIDYTLDGSISTACQEEKTNKTENDIENESPPSSDTPSLVKIRSIVSTSHSQVGNTPENESKEGIEE